MIDNGRVTLEEPERHTVHCLVDVGICLDTAFEVLIESSSGSTAYSRGYRLDDDSKSDILSLARSVGSCTTCANGYDNSMLRTGFKAVMKVTVLDLNPDNGESAPPLVRVNERKDSSSLGNDPCQSEYNMAEGIAVSAPTNIPTPPPTRPPTPPPTPPPTSTPPPTPGPTPEPTPGPTQPPAPTSTNPTVEPISGPTLAPGSGAPREPTPRPTLGPTATSNSPSLRPSDTASTKPTQMVTTTAPTVAPNAEATTQGDLADSGAAVTSKLLW
ncbi:MAG: hypothetical protein SGBAC_005326, partial [Bacillariaceae sp.]